MKTEETEADDNIQNQTELPPYPEMILAAIEAFGSANGSNKSSISKQIVATHRGLPRAHNKILSHHLNWMKSSGQLLFIKNHYLIPNPNAPPRRGRGRPPNPRSISKLAGNAPQPRCCSKCGRNYVR